MSTTVVCYLESAPDTPLTGAFPTLTYWDRSSPAAPYATDVAMTELVGGAGGLYYVDVDTYDGIEYAGLIDRTAGAMAGSRYQIVSFSGTTIARIEEDIPGIRHDTEDIQDEISGMWFWQVLSLILGLFNLWRVSEVWRLMGLDRDHPVVNDVGSRKSPADGHAINQDVTTDGSEITVERVDD